jgi:pimeloyl-ACP methyl ester carboxylesterase
MHINDLFRPALNFNEVKQQLHSKNKATEVFLKSLHFYITQGSAKEQKTLKQYRGRIKAINKTSIFKVALPESRADQAIRLATLPLRVFCVFLLEILSYPTCWIIDTINLAKPNFDLIKKNNNKVPILLVHGYTGNQASFLFGRAFLNSKKFGSVFSLNVHTSEKKILSTLHIALAITVGVIALSALACGIYLASAPLITISALCLLGLLKNIFHRGQNLSEYTLDEGLINLQTKIQEIQNKTKCKEIILIGHSMGGLLAFMAAHEQAKKEKSDETKVIIRHIFSMGTPWRGTKLTADNAEEAWINFFHKKIKKYAAACHMGKPSKASVQSLPKLKEEIYAMHLLPYTTEATSCSIIHKIACAALQHQKDGTMKFYNAFSTLDHVSHYPDAIITDDPSKQKAVYAVNHGWLVATCSIWQWFKGHLEKIYTEIEKENIAGKTMNIQSC